MPYTELASRIFAPMPLGRRYPLALNQALRMRRDPLSLPARPPGHGPAMCVVYP